VAAAWLISPIAMQHCNSARPSLPDRTGISPAKWIILYRRLSWRLSISDVFATGIFLICHALKAKQQKSEQLVELLAPGALAKQ
jgi:hypothetical protein